MKTLHNYTIERETLDEQTRGKRYNPAKVLLIHQHRLPLAAGNGDEIDVFGEGDWIYVVSVSVAHGYAGLEVFDAATGDDIGDVFAQNDDAVREMLGPKGVDLHPRTIARRFADYAIQ